MNDAMQTIREALESCREFFKGFTCTCDPDVGYMCEPCARADEMRVAIASLDSLAGATSEDVGEFIDQICDNDLHENERIALVVERDERIRRECADRAVKWQKRLCTLDDWSCKKCNECEQLEASILTPEATNGQ